MDSWPGVGLEDEPVAEATAPETSWPGVGVEPQPESSVLSPEDWKQREAWPGVPGFREANPYAGLEPEEAERLYQSAVKYEQKGIGGKALSALGRAGMQTLEVLDKAVGFYEEHGMYGREEEAGEVFAPDLREARMDSNQVSAVANRDKPLTQATEMTVESLGKAAASAYMGIPVILGFTGYRASDAEAEADEAGKTGLDKWGYVGRAAAIEGGLTYAFQRVGLGGFEKYFGKGPIRPQSVKEFAKSLGVQAAAEVLEENAVEIADQYNQKLSGVSDADVNPMEIFKQVSLPAIMGTGVMGGVQQLRTRKVTNQMSRDAEASLQGMGFEKGEAERLVKQAWDQKPETAEEFYAAFAETVVSDLEAKAREAYEAEAAANARPVSEAGPDAETAGSEWPGQSALPPGQPQQAIPGRNQIPGLPMRREVTTDMLTESADTDTGLTQQEANALPVNQVERQQATRTEQWQDKLEKPLSDARKRIMGRVAAQRLSEIDHPIARFQSLIMRDRYNKVKAGSKDAKQNRQKKWGIRKEGLDSDVWEQLPQRFKNDQYGYSLEELGEKLEIAIGDEVDELGLNAENLTGSRLLELVSIPKVDKQTGEQNFIPEELRQEMEEAERYFVPELDRDLIEDTPVSEVMKRIQPNSVEPMMLVRPRDLEDGDILKIGPELYEVQQRGAVKVLQDGTTIPVEEYGDGQLNVDTVVPASHPLHGELKAAYEAMHAEEQQAYADREQARADIQTQLEARQAQQNLEVEAQESIRRQTDEETLLQQERQADDAQAGQPPREEAQAARAEAEPLTLEPVTPAELEAEKDRLAAQAGKKKAEDQLNTARKGTAGDLGQGQPVGVEQSEAIQPLYHAGDRIALTGNDVDGFQEFVYLEGIKEGQTGLRAYPDDVSARNRQRQEQAKEQGKAFQRLANNPKNDQSGVPMETRFQWWQKQESVPDDVRMEFERRGFDFDNGLTLEAVTPAELEAEKDRLAEQAGKKKAEDQLNTARKGTTGDLGQGQLFNEPGQMELGQGPTAQDQVTANRQPATPNPLTLVQNGIIEHSALIRSELRKVGVRLQDMDDRMQDVAARALEKADTFNPDKAKVQTWLGTLARNVAKNEFAKSTAKMRDERATVSLQAPVGTDADSQLMDMIPASDRGRNMNAYQEALAVTPLDGLQADIRDGVLAGKGVEDIAAEQGLTPQKVMGILKVIGRKAQRELPTEIREADIAYGLQQKQIPANEFPQAVRDQLDFFQRLEAVPAAPYQGTVVPPPRGNDLQRRKAALAKAFADPLNPKNWQGILKHGEPASYVIRELVKRPTDLSWPVEGVKIQSAKDVMSLTMMLRSPYQESLKIMGLNDDNVVLGGVVHSVGAVNSSAVYTGNLLGQLPPGTTKVVLVHNHPSGDPIPSPEDMKVSRDIQEALNMVGLELMDHVTTDDWKYFSQRESNLVTFTKPVKSSRVPGKVVVPPEKSVQDVVGDEPEVQMWSLINRGDNRLKFEGIDDVNRFAETLRQGHPDAAFLVGTDSRTQVTGVTLLESVDAMRADDYMAVKQAMMVQEEAARFFILHPESGDMSGLLPDTRNLVKIGKQMGRELLDVADAFGNSIRSSGLVAFEPRKIYRSAVMEVRDLSEMYRTGREKLDQVARYLNARKRGAEYRGPGVESADPDVEARLKAAKTLERKPWWKRENWRETARAFNRAFPEIGDTEGRLIYELETVNHVAGAAEMISQSALLDITEGMGSGQMELFERILAARDVRRSIGEGLYEDSPLPFGWKSPEAVDADLANWESQLEDNPQVEQALERRRRYMGELRRQLVDHELLPEAVRDEDDYFRRLTLEYMRESANQTGGQKGLRDEKSGFQKRRKGGGDFVLDYLTAEHDVISHAIASLKYKEIRDTIQTLADKSGELKQQAKERNRAAVHGGEENYARVRNVLEQVGGLKAEEKYMGDGMSNAQEIAELLATIEDIDILRPFRGLKAKAISMWEQATGQEFPDGNPNDVMTATMQGEYGEGAGYTAGQWFSAIQQEEKFIKDQLGREYIRWRGGKVDKRLIPEGYVPYAIKPGHRMFRAMSVSEAVLEEVIEGHRDLLQEDVKEVLVSAGAYPEWVIPENLARALRRMENSGAPSNAVDRVIQKGVGRWKGYKLTAPWHFPKYTFNNATGDTDFMLALEPRIGKYVKQAIRESYSVNVKRKMTPEMEELALNGVLGGIMRAEIGSIRQAELFSALSGEKPGLLNSYMQKVGGFSKFREDILRLAAYRYYQDALARGERPHGASNYEQVESLYERGDMKQAAMLLARQAMLDYNNPTEVTNFLRNRYIPFATFKMGNIQRYLRLMRNLAKENDVLSQETARAGAVMSGRLARKALIGVGFATLMSSLVAAWNRLMFPEDEESLRRNNREGQMIIGVGDDGIARTLRIEGSLTAFTNALGMEESGRKARELAAGEVSAGETMLEIAGDAASDWVSSAVPGAKTMLEAATRQQLWPDMFNPRPVRDRAEHLAGYVSANHLYNRLSGKPLPEHRRGLASLQNWILYSTDLGEMDYWYTRNLVDDYLEQKQGSYISTSKRDNALYYYRKALQYEDYEAQQKYLNLYLDEGGKLRNITRNLDNRHPLNDLKGEIKREAFRQQLKPSDRRAYENALKWYQRTMKMDAKDKEIMTQVVRDRLSTGKQTLLK